MHERKHRLAKRWAVPLDSETGYENTILEECTYSHLQALEQPLLKPSMEDPRPADTKLVEALQEAGYVAAGVPQSVLTSLAVRVHARKISVGDVVLYHGGGCKDNLLVGEAYCHACIDGRCFTCVSTWNIVERSKHWLKAIVTDNPGPIPAEWLLQSTIFTPAAVGKKATVLMPCYLL